MKALREWLLLPDPALRTRDRVVVAATRCVLAVALLASAVLAVLPFLQGESAREGRMGDVGVGGLIVLGCVLPVWILPCAIWQTGALRVDEDVLVAYTLRDRRALPLAQVTDVRVWSLDARGIFAKLSGGALPAVWLSWSGSGFRTSARLDALTRDIARREGVRCSPRAQEVLELPGAPRGVRSLFVWLRSLAGIVIFGVGMAAAIIAYVNLEFGLPVWSR